MEPALDVIGRTLHGDNGARAFLERTSSIYVLDVMDPQNPKTYGCWNFIHQALNEVERYEATLNGNGIVDKNGTHNAFANLVPHVRLLASMALKVARRSHKGDRAIVRTCISNASDYNCSASQAQWLFDLNLELREIVMGRIAAIAFDFSFHRSSAASENDKTPQQQGSSSPTSAFADAVVMDTFSAVLAANAVATGPAAVRHFATEWIIPSSRNIPVLALVSVTHHLALEGMRPTAPAGIMDMLQQLSVPICSMVLVPAMAEAASDSNEELESNGEQSASFVHANNSRILAKTLMALDVWCGATTLTLPQLRHISSKVNLNIVDILNDIMYSDSPEVVGAMADFIDRAMESPLETETSEDRMNQVRHIINVSESAFKANFSAEHLRVIENKEMASILEEVSSAIGLQRIRFVDLQKQGNLEVCRNLARMGRGVASAWLEVYRNDGQQQPEHGLIEFLFKTLSHPSIKIHGVTLGVTSEFVSAQTSLGRELLPLLQRKVIIPHHTNEAGILSLLQTDQYGVTIDEFLHFREHVIADALCACWKFDSETYLNSCTSAIEEFCSGDAGANLSFHLEAALFCVESVGSQLHGSDLVSFADQLSRCMASLSKKTNCITSNPLAIARLASFLQKWAVWFHRSGKIASAGDLAVAALSYSLVLSSQSYAQAMVRDTQASPVLEACLALKKIISVEPDHFCTEGNLNALIVVWHSLYSERKRGMPVSLDSIEPLGNGICTAIMHSNESIQLGAFESLASPVIDSIEQLFALVKITSDESSPTKLLESIGEELRLLSCLIRTLSSSSHESGDEQMEEDENGHVAGNRSRRPSRRADVPAYALAVVRRCLPSIEVIASEYNDNVSVCSSVCEFLSESISHEFDMEGITNSSKIIMSMLRKPSSGSTRHIEHICQYMEVWVSIHGCETLELAASESISNGMIQSDNSRREVSENFQEILLQTLASAEPCLGSTWIDPGENTNMEQTQGQGQQAFESRAPALRKFGESDCHCLGPVLSLLRELRQTCPTFLLNCPGKRHGEKQDFLIARAAHSAVHALNADDSEVVLSAIEFLEVLIRPREVDSEMVRSKLRDRVSISRTGLLRRLFIGCCGRFEHSLLSQATELLYSFFRFYPTEPLMLDISSAFHQQQEQDRFFHLGDDARERVLICLRRNCSKSDQEEPRWSVKELGEFLEQLWDLHRQTDDVSTLPESDVTARFIRRFAA